MNIMTEFIACDKMLGRSKRLDDSDGEKKNKNLKVTFKINSMN